MYIILMLFKVFVTKYFTLLCVLLPNVISTTSVPNYELGEIWQLRTFCDISDLYLKRSSSDVSSSHTIRFTFQFSWHYFTNHVCCLWSQYLILLHHLILILRLPSHCDAIFCVVISFFNMKVMLLLLENKDVYVCLYCNYIYLYRLRREDTALSTENLFPMTTFLHQKASSFHFAIFSIYFHDSLIPFFYWRTPG